MNFALGLFTSSLLGADGSPKRQAPDISYEVRVLKINGLDWRGEFFSRLQPIASQSGATVWTTDRETADTLSERDPNGVKAPKVIMAPQAPAHIVHRTTRKITTGLNRMADGPFDHATRVAYTPSYDEIREGWAMTVSSRKIDQGVLACVVVEETRIDAVHQVSLTERVAAPACCEDEGVCASQGKKLASRIDVPEIAHAAAEGEWLIPNEGILVVSLGVQTSADEQGKAVVRERLVLIEARPIHDDTVRRASTMVPFAPRPAAPRAPSTWGPAAGRIAGTPAGPEAAVPMPMPTMPSRSLPQALAADGSPMQLPPLPDNPATPSSMPGTSEPCASPQAPNRRTAASTLDSDSAKISFSPMSKPSGNASESDTKAQRSPLSPSLSGQRWGLERRGGDSRRAAVDESRQVPYFESG